MTPLSKEIMAVNAKKDAAARTTSTEKIAKEAEGTRLVPQPALFDCLQLNNIV